MNANDDSIGHLIAQTVDAFGLQIELHIELLKAELAQDSKVLSMALAPLLLAVPLLGVGYLFFSMAVVLALKPWLGMLGSYTCVAVLNLIAGSIAIHLSVLRLRARHIIGATVGAEIEKSTKSIAAALSPIERHHVS